MTFLYLDHAATSWPKPPEVLRAVAAWFTDCGVSAERGDSERSAAVARRVRAIRAALASRCGVPSERLVFTSGATEAAHLLLRGLLGTGDRVVTTAIEHSAVVRTLVALRDELGLELDVLPCDAGGVVDPDDVARACSRRTARLLVVSQASNVTGAIQDVAAMLGAARDGGALVLVDASQAAGCLALDVGADALFASAHKSLLGPPGLGFFAVAPTVELRQSRFGGTGSSTALDAMPRAWPQAFEPGTPNTPAILGLGAALDWLSTADGEALAARQHRIVDAIAARLGAGSRALRPASRAQRLPILSLLPERLDPAEAGLLLDAAGIHVRSGFHCAPWIHARLGSERSGTLRISPGPFVSEDAASRVVAALDC